MTAFPQAAKLPWREDSKLPWREAAGARPALLFMYQYVNGLLPCGSVLDCGARRTARLGGEEDSILLPGLPISLL